MPTTTNMGLTFWEKGTEYFEHSKLASNWVIIDAHNHSGEPGKGVKLNAASALEPGSITTVLLALKSVTGAILGTEAVETGNIKARSVTSEKIALEAIINELIANGTITMGKLNATVFPLGIVVPWYTASPTTYTAPVGENTPWEICDGKPWSSAKGNKMGALGAELTTGNMPNLIEKYAMFTTAHSGGFKVEGPNIGESGGASSANLSHSHTINAHSHVVGSHTHSIAEAGYHKHNFDGGNYLTTRPNAFPNHSKFEYKGSAYEATLQSLYVPGASTEGEETHVGIPMDTSGEHTHGGGNTGHAEPTTTEVALTTNSSLTEVSISPPHVAFLPIMRVR